jgi:hypothetical protein
VIESEALAVGADSRRAHPWRDAAFLVAVIVDAWLLIVPGPTFGPADALSWWTINLADPYGQAVGSMTGSGAFRYSPAVAQLFAPFHLLPWGVFVAAFLALQLVVVVVVSGRRWPLVVLVPPVLLNLFAGNVDTLMGMAIVVGFRWPGAWAVLILTKITPGIGVLWFAFRREWRRLAIALGLTALIVVVSFAAAPHLWFEWFDALRAMSRLPQSDLVPPLLVRLPIALGITAFAARTNRKWLVPVASFVAVPNPWLVTGALLGGSVALYGEPPSQTEAHPVRIAE